MTEGPAPAAGSRPLGSANKMTPARSSAPIRSTWAPRGLFEPRSPAILTRREGAGATGGPGATTGSGNGDDGEHARGNDPGAVGAVERASRRQGGVQLSARAHRAVH